MAWERTAAQVYKDGPSGTPSQPAKDEIRPLLKQYENAIDSLGLMLGASQGAVKATKSALLAVDDDFEEDDVGVVFADTDSNNGVYVHNGTTFVKDRDLPGFAAEVAAEVAEGYRDETFGYRNESENFRDDARSSRDLAAGYASDAVSQGNVPIYATLSGMSAITVPAGIAAFRVNGYASTGDVGAALYKRVTSEPSHPGKVRTADRYLPNGTTSSGNGGWWELAERIVRPEMLGDVETAFHTALTYALQAAHAIDAEKVLLQKRRYLLEGSVSVSAINIDLDGNDARIERSAASGNYLGLDITGGFENTRSVVAVTKALYAYGTSDSMVTRIELANDAAAASYAVNDVIKIIGDDLIPSSPSGSNERIGETARIGAISTKYLYLYKLLVENYTTNIRIARIVETKTALRDFSIGDEAGSSDARRLSLIRLSALVEPTLRQIECSDGLTIGLERRSCHAPRTFGYRGRKLRTVPSSEGDGGTFAYGIVAFGETDGIDDSPSGEKLRHAYTTGCLSSGTDDADFTKYGGVIRGTVNNGVAVDCENAAWDTHGDAYGVVFNNCRQGPGNRGPAGSYYSHQLRGRRCRIVGGQSSAPSGVSVYMYGNDGDHYVEIDHERQEGVGTSTSLLRVIATDSPTKGRITLKARIRCNDGNTPLIEADNVEFTPESFFSFDYKFSSTGPHCFDLTNSIVRGKMNVDFSRTLLADVSGSVRIFRFQDANNDVALESLNIKTDSDSRQIYFVNGQTFNGRAVFPRVDIDKGVLTGVSGFLDMGGSSVFWARETYSQGTRAGRAFFTQAYTVTGDQGLTWNVRGDNVVVARVSASVSGVGINSLQAGAFDGQQLCIINNNGTPAENVTIKHNTSGLIAIGGGGATKVLSPYQSIVLIWSVTSGVWRPYSGFTP